MNKIKLLTRDISTNMKRTKNEQSVHDLPFTGPLKLACNKKKNPIIMIIIPTYYKINQFVFI